MKVSANSALLLQHETMKRSESIFQSILKMILSEKAFYLDHLFNLSLSSLFISMFNLSGLREVGYLLVCQSIDQSISQSMNQSTNQAICQ